MLASLAVVALATALTGTTPAGLPTNIAVHLIPRCSRPARCLHPVVVQLVKSETSRIWSLFDVRIDWIDSTGPAGAMDVRVDVTVFLEENAEPEAGGFKGPGFLLGRFHEPDSPCGTGLIRLWAAQTRRHAAAVQVQGLPFENLPEALIDLLLARSLGRALAHEIGHYVFGTAHTAHGLMRPSFTPAELIEPISKARYGMQESDRRVLRSCRGITADW